MTDRGFGDDAIEAGRRLAAAPWRFATAASSLASLPPMAGVEVAFAGRSNVGKSSLINALVGQSGLARTSHTPGRTQELIFFSAGGPLTLVDMPGYGYAAVSKEKVAAWTGLIHDYLRGRVNLARVFLLIDARHGLKDADRAVLDTLDSAAVSYQPVLTKADELKAQELQTVTEKVAAALGRRPAAYPQVAVTSSRSGLGLPDLRAELARLSARRSP